MYVRKRGNKTSFSLTVVGIKVTRPIWKLDDHGVYETYYRTIRFELYGGKVLDVHCSGVVEEYIQLRSVKTLKPRSRKPNRGIKPKSTTPGTPDNTDWLTPKLYEGDRGRPTGTARTTVSTARHCQRSAGHAPRLCGAGQTTVLVVFLSST